MVPMFRKCLRRLDSLLGADIERVVARIAERPGRTSFYLLVFTIVVGGGAFSVTEPDADWFDGVWWAMVTLTTVGYGDFSPESFLGRWVGALVMMGGIVSVAILTGLIGGEIAKRRLQAYNETPELDDDIEQVIDTVTDQLRALQKQVSHPKVINALKEIHAENGGSTHES
jgi:hypothetical protein